MIGRVLTSLSRTTAKWPEVCSADSSLLGPIAEAAPRWAIRRVTSWKAVRPLPVKPKVTLGAPDSSTSCLGRVTSVPESAGLSFSANQPGSAFSSTWPLRSLGFSETTIVPCGTLSTLPMPVRRLRPLGVR